MTKRSLITVLHTAKRLFELILFYSNFYVFFLRSIIATMESYPRFIELEKTIDFIMAKIDLYNMYLVDNYFGQKEVSSSKLWVIKRVLIGRGILLERLFMYIDHLKYIPSSVASVFFKERVIIRLSRM